MDDFSKTKSLGKDLLAKREIPIVMPTASTSGLPLGDALTAFLSTVPDASLLVVNSTDGDEIATATKGDASTMTEDGELMSALIPRLIVSADQANRLNLGSIQYSITWMGRRILLHMKLLPNLSVSLLLEDTANLGLIDEHIDGLKKVLEVLA